MSDLIPLRYEKPNNPKLWGRLEPYTEDAPDIAKLIHWRADVIVTQGFTHEILKSQRAYFLYAWPVLKSYLREQNYSVIIDDSGHTVFDFTRNRSREGPLNFLVTMAVLCRQMPTVVMMSSFEHPMQ